MSMQTTRRSFGRRTFLRRAGTLALAPWIVPAAARGADGAIAPSNRVTLGFIGLGYMGQKHHLSRFLQYPEAQVLAVCDVDRWRREHAHAMAAKAYGAQHAGGAKTCAAYVDFRDLLARSDIDGVLIATGDRWHGVATVMAAQASKDIYVEKPISLTIAEARAMVDAVRRYGRVCQCGLQQRSAVEFQLACDLIRQGAIGKIERIYVVYPGVSQEVDLPAEPVPAGLDWERWLGPAPWRPFNRQFHQYGEPKGVVPWNFCRDFGGGLSTSNNVHAYDIVQWALGMEHAGPVEIIPPATGQFPDLTFKYPGDVLVHVVDGHLDPQKHLIPKGWNPLTSIQNFGGVYVGERGWIHVGRNGYLASHPAELVRNGPGPYDRFLALIKHQRNWLHSIRTRCRPACDVAIGCRSTMVAHLGGIASWVGRSVKWDAAQEEFVGDGEANRMRRRALREPWRV